MSRISGLFALTSLALLACPAAAGLRADAPVCVGLFTPLGTITLELLPARAPRTVANFLRYVDGRRYDGASFYRTVSPANDHNERATNLLIQGGLRNDVPGFPSPPLESTNVTGIRHIRGTISMGRGAPDTAGSEFFITLRPEPSLDFGGNRKEDGLGFSAFGHVVHGMAIVERIHAMEAHGVAPGPYFQDQYLTHPVVIRRGRRLPRARC